MHNYSRGWNGAEKHPVSANRKSPYQSRRHNKSFLTSVQVFILAAFSWIWKVVRWIIILCWNIVAWILSQKGLTKKVLFSVLVGGLAAFVIFGFLIIYYSFTLPDPNKLASRIIPESTKIFDRNETLLYEIHGDIKRTLVPLDLIPDHVQQATIAIEDKDFLLHRGISWMGITRSIVVNIASQSKAQGGSTITQQFVRNAVLTREKLFTRKFKELILSFQLERKYDKHEILQLYFNEIPYGSTLYGIQAASQSFFGKNVDELSLAEGAYLAAIPNAPTFYSPYGPNRDKLDARANVVLQLMYEQEYISLEEKNQAQAEEVVFKKIGDGITAPHFVLYVQSLLAEKFGELSLQEGGLKVITTLDLEMQKAAEEAVAAFGEQNEKNFNASNASLVAIDPKSGHILALVGSRGYFNEDIDGAVNVALRPRQPGSSFKPYIYAAAFKQGMSPATMLIDVVTNFGNFGGQSYIPRNYNNNEYGPVSIRSALAGSLNIPAVKTMMLVGVNNAIDVAENMGITTLKDRSRYGPSLVLGGGEVRLLDHVSAFGVFAAGGIRHEPTAILRIEDKRGRVLEEYQESRGREVLDTQTAYQISHILSDNGARSFIFGPSNHLSLPGRQVAVKTGTTQEFRDAWTVGYTPNLSAGVWVGNNNNTAMRAGADGSVVAAPIWNSFMRKVLASVPSETFPRPNGIVEITVDRLSGKLPSPYTPETKVEVFASFNAPTEIDDIHLPNGQVILHSEMPNNPAWEEPVKRWALANGYGFSDGYDEKLQPSDDVDIELSHLEKISSLPWRVEVKGGPEQDIATIELFLDGSLISSSASSELRYESFFAHSTGSHKLTARVITKDNKINQQTSTINFDLNNTIALIMPRDNQTLSFPVNVVVESSLNVASENVEFFIRPAGGERLRLTGFINKQTIGGIYHYTLNWATSDKPASGSYAISANISGVFSNEVAVKVP